MYIKDIHAEKLIKYEAKKIAATLYDSVFDVDKNSQLTCTEKKMLLSDLIEASITEVKKYLNSKF